MKVSFDAMHVLFDASLGHLWMSGWNGFKAMSVDACCNVSVYWCLELHVFLVHVWNSISRCVFGHFRIPECQLACTLGCFRFGIIHYRDAGLLGLLNCYLG